MPIFGITASSNQTVKFTDFYQIATTTVGSGGTSSITFSSIPADYTHLQIRGMVITGANFSSDVKMNFNSDTGNNYSLHGLYGNGSSALSFATINIAYACVGYQGKTSAPSSFVTDILDYRNTNKFKTVKSLIATDDNGAGRVDLISSNWRNSSAITSITLTNFPSGNFNQYTSIQLYGVKA
jgi:hypothetical protein